MSSVAPSPTFGSFTGGRVPWMAYATWGLLGLAVAYSLFRTVGITEDFQSGDFGAYYRAGCAVAQGETPYIIDVHGHTEAFVYAPAYAYLICPLSSLDYAWAVRLWTLLSWAFCMVCVRLAFSLVAEKKLAARWSWGTFWLAVLPIANYFWTGVRVGQAGALLGALCLGWAVCQRRGRPFAGGLLLAAAVALKVAPVVLLPYLVVRRDWRGLAGVLAGGLAFFTLPAGWVGWEGSLRLHLEWPRLCQQTQTIQTVIPQNQSLLTVLARLPMISNGHDIYSASNLHGLESAYPLIVLALATILYALVFWHRRQGAGQLAPDQERHRANLHLALLFVFMALVSPRAWPCNFTVVIVASCLLADTIRCRAPGWILALGALGLVAVVTATPKSYDPAAAWSWGLWIYQSKDFWALIALAGTCAYCCTRHRQPQLGQESGRPGQPLAAEERRMLAA